jgi:histidine triad (HIT) family protein
LRGISGAMVCQICEQIEKTGNKIYEDDQVVALLTDSPAAIGHVIIIPKQHFPIIENVPDPVVARLFQVANKMSSVAFEALGAMGTNILVNNGVAAGQEENHVTLHVIPRRENDGINLQWQMRQTTDEDLSTAELQITDAAKPEQPKQVIVESRPQHRVDDYLLDSLTRIP